MSRFCVVPGCTTKAGQGITLFEFPNWFNNEARRAQWLKNIGLLEKNLNSLSCVCKNHFDKLDTIQRGANRFVLKPDAVPTIFQNKTSATEMRVESLMGASASVDEPLSNSPARETPPLESPISGTMQSPQPGPSGSSTVTSGNVGSIYMPTPEQVFVSKTMTENYRQPEPDGTFLVMESNLRKLFKRCQECGAKIEKEVRFYIRGGHLRVEIFCDQCGQVDWHSFPFLHHMSHVNLLVPISTITGGNIWENLHQFADGCKLAIPSEKEFYDVANAYVYPMVTTLYNKKNEELLEKIRYQQRHGSNVTDRYLEIAVDTRYSQPGHSATYATTSAIDIRTKKIIKTEITVKHYDAKSSQALELQGTKMVLNSLLGLYEETDLSGQTSVSSSSSSASSSDERQQQQQQQRDPIRIGTLVTDEHKSIIAAMRKEPYNTIRHQGDVWHFVKRVKKHISKKCKASVVMGRTLAPWIKSITNFVWTICKECQEDPDLLEELWKSMLYHVSNRHSWPRTEELPSIDKCLHGPMSAEKEKSIGWINRKSKAYQFLNEMVYDEEMIKSLRRCCDFLHTSEVESFHSCLLKFLPKRLCFEYNTFTARTYMTILHFNENIGRPLLRKETGATKTRFVLPPSTKQWVAKAAFVPKSYEWRRELIELILQQRLQLSALAGHRLYRKKIREVPTQVSFVPRPPREQADEEFRKRRRLSE